VVMESTYGDRDHGSNQDIDDKLSTVVNNAVKASGDAIIPTFAIERAQELLYRFGSLARTKRIPYIVTFLDSPMAVKSRRSLNKARSILTKRHWSSSRMVNLLLTFRG
jgi:metallo-beta-lactamase family protein